jgi:hypothetical protein
VSYLEHSRILIVAVIGLVTLNTKLQKPKW